MLYDQQTQRKRPRNGRDVMTAFPSRRRRGWRIILTALVTIMGIVGILVFLTGGPSSQMKQAATSANAAETMVTLDLDGDWVSADVSAPTLTLSNGRYQFAITNDGKRFTEEGTLRQQGASLSFDGGATPSAITYIGYGNSQLMLQWSNQILILTRNHGNTQGA